MSRIRQLSADVVAKIAAGEVIERPASVVKELLENSLDAGATHIDIELEGGGTETIRVVDNGHGMAADDLPLAVTSHATSKLKDADDLFRIGTMGFRGEALASIAGVAHVAIQSRTREASEGAELRNMGGAVTVRPWGGAVGTRIEVKQLFYNVPARKKFLKTIATELRTASEMVTKLALSHPAVGFSLRHNGRTVVEVPGNATLADRIELFFGSEIRNALLEIDTGPGLPRLTGFVCDPAVDRGNAQMQYLFVNGRWFRDRSMQHAMQEAYRGLLMTGRYAIGFLFLTVPPDTVDVNVHPTKSEVRFRENSAIYSLVRGAVKQRLMKENLIPSLRVPQGVDPDSPRRETAERVVAPWESGKPDPTLPFRFPVSSATKHIPFEPNPDPLLVPRDLELERSIRFDSPVPDDSGRESPRAEPAPVSDTATEAFQLHDSYLVLETREGMLVIDQHALHERILFEQLRTRIRDGQLEIQRLLVPEPVELPPVQAAAVVEAREELLSLGLDVSDFGGNTVLLSAYPSLLSRRSPRDILLAVVDELASKDRPPAKEQLLHLLMATMACKAAVKAGDKLSGDEIAYLLHLRTMAEDSHHCPHGRPTSLLFSRSELDRQFKRT
jgi:DNA mismatch repair protein MutL